jgi:GNAT superfamily N-acetyltransferase
MASIDGLAERRLTPDDADRAQHLVVEAGWNQVPGDWRLMLQLGQGFGVEGSAGGLVGTALSLPLGGRISWISMVLVAKSARRNGLGTRLLQRCIEDVTASGRVAGLDATELGRPVYLPLGFRDIYGLRRIVVPQGGAKLGMAAPGLMIAPIAGEAALVEVIAWDAGLSGLERGPILRNLRDRMPHCAWAGRRNGRLAGYVLAREGRNATQIGPVVAEDAETAAMLTAIAAQSARTQIYVDVPDVQAAFRAWLDSCGASVQRGYMRMLLDEDRPFDRADRIFAIAGPELA